MIKILSVQEQNGRVQKQLEVETLIRASCHQYYKHLLHTPFSSLCPHYCSLSSFSFGMRSFCRTFCSLCYVLHALWQQLLVCLCLIQANIQQIQKRRDVSICSDTLTSDDLSVCQSFIKEGSI